MKTTHYLASAAIAALALSAVALSTFPVTPAYAQAAQDDSIATNNGALVIHPIHHASVMLTFAGKHILVDPASAPGAPQGSDPTPEYKAMPAPDAILITHAHPDHFNVAILTAVAGANTVIVAPQNVVDQLPPPLKAKAKVMKNGDKMDVAGVPVEAVAMYNVTADRLMFHPKGQGNGYVLTAGGKRVYLAGDTEETPELKTLPNIDVAFLPMNLPYTETVEAAAVWVKDFKPKIVYPYHYGMSDVNAFKAMVGTASEVRLRKWY